MSEITSTLLPAPVKVKLSAMWKAAQDEADRLEISELTRMKFSGKSEPLASQIAKRDAFLGLARLVDRILSDKELLQLLATEREGVQ